MNKVTPDHLRRRACVYVRQSSLRQVQENTESVHRQYDLVHRAMALGWLSECIDVIDDDQGQSGATSTHRTGFRDLLGRVAAKELGLVLSLEVSRLSRNNADWHQLLYCRGDSDAFVDGLYVYDLNHPEDRLMLGIKGTLSEYELHRIQVRLIGGQCSKARRGALKVPLPMGLVYDMWDRVVLDPNHEITEAIVLVLSIFRRNAARPVYEALHKQMTQY